MIVRSYALAIFMFDFMVLMFRTYLAVISTVFKIFVPNKPKKMRHEIVMIVGSGRGVGREIALQIGLTGAKVICIDINSTNNENTVRKIQAIGGSAYAYTCDVTIPEEVEKVIELINTNIGNITMLFHCASVPSARSITTLEPQTIKKSMEVNVVSYFYVSKSSFNTFIS